MIPLGAAVETAIAIALLSIIAGERMRAHRLGRGVLDVRAFAIAIGVTLTRAWLAQRGMRGVDSSLVLAIAAVAAITDLQCGYVFDRMLVAGSAALIAADTIHGSLAPAFAGGAAGALILAVPWALSRGRGMGFGDVKLAGVLSCGLGPSGALRSLWFAFVIGAIAAVAWILACRRSRNDALPFAPYLAIGTVLSLGTAAP